MALPRMGLGTWQITGDGANRAVRYALDAAYRHVDTVRLYDNDEQIGRAIRGGGIDRDDLFLTTNSAHTEPRPPRRHSR